MGENFIEWRLLLRILDSSAGAEDHERFNEWMAADPAHEAYFQRLKADWTNGAAAVADDPDQMFRELMRQTGASSAPAAAGRPARRNTVRWIAAGTAACVAVCCVFLLHKHKEHLSREEGTTRLSEYILPGTHKATLELYDGSTIKLSDEPFEIKLPGASITKDSMGALRHDVLDEAATKYNRIIVPLGGFYDLKLSDGTTVWLNSGSELYYPLRFTGGERRVRLIGEGYFSVEPSAGQPFIVDADDYSVEVLGTEFNLSAYPDDADVSTTLVEGKVKVMVEGFDGYDVIEHGMQLTYNRQTEMKTIREVNAAAIAAWKDGIFEFRNTSFEKLIRVVSRWYDFEYIIDDTLLCNYHFTGAFYKDGSIDNLFRILKSSKIPVEIVYDGDVIIFRKTE